ncbi:unnamed protein product [Cylicostephanus goldi]|uniref:Uncharacterized protein n=1 Tax=Cylicostephanus goldi TaxID=71465 RepID=A0A3P7R1N2_CYLGO|nr:unnamed protein product [Cylicostephanus goldi]
MYATAGRRRQAGWYDHDDDVPSPSFLVDGR